MADSKSYLARSAYINGGKKKSRRAFSICQVRKTFPLWFSRIAVRSRSSIAWVFSLDLDHRGFAWCGQGPWLIMIQTPRSRANFDCSLTTPTTPRPGAKGLTFGIIRAPSIPSTGSPCLLLRTTDFCLTDRWKA